jgi:ribosomal protein L16 Arg81 hydroxylase
MKSPKGMLSPRGFLSPRSVVKSPEQQRREAEIETLRNWVAKQKHDNYEALKLWDQRRAALLVVHSKLLQQLREGLQQRLHQSFEFMRLVRQFLTEHCRQLVSSVSSHRNSSKATVQRILRRNWLATLRPQRSTSKPLVCSTVCTCKTSKVIS